MGSEMVDAFERGLAAPVMAANNGSDVRMCGYTMCNGNSLAKTRLGEDSYFRTQKYGVCYNNALKRMNKLLTLLRVYIWIGVLFCCVHLGAANTTQEMNVTTVNMTTVELTTIGTTNLPEVTTELTTENIPDDVEPWVYGVAAAGGVVLIVVIIIIIVCIKKRNSHRNPPAPVEKDLTSSQDGLDRDIGFSGGHTVNNQGDVNIPMDNFGQAVEESIYQNTSYQSEAQDNLGFNHSLPDSPIDENFPAHPPPSPPRGAARNMDARPPMGIPSPFVATLPGLEPVSPLDDIPQRPPPAVPSQEAKDKTATKKKKDKKEKKKNDKPKAPQRYIDPNEQIREGIPLTTTSPPPSHPMPVSQSMIPPKFDFRTRPSELDTGDDFGDNYEEMSPVDSNATKGWSPRQPAEDYGGDYEDVGGGGVNEDMDYDDDYEVMDPNDPGPRKPTGGKRAIPLPVNKLTGPRSPPNMNQRPMVLPPPLSGGEDFGDEYEEMCPGESPTRRVPGGNIDNRPQIPIPHQDEEQDHGGEYELVNNTNISPKKKMAVPKPKTAKKPKPTPPGDFGQEYGNTGNSAMLPTSTTQRLPPSLPSSSTLPQTPKKLFNEEDDWLPPPPPELDQRPPATIPSTDNIDYGGDYDDVEINKPPVTKKPPVPKPKLAKKPTNTGSSSTLPVSPKQQAFSTAPRSSATLPVLGEKESILEEDSTYMNLPSLKGDLSTHYRNLPSPQKTQEHVTSSGYTYFTERPK